MGVRRAFWGTLLLGAVALAAPAGAVAEGLLAPSGALIYAWHGDRTRGCAAVGVCGVQGVLIVRPAPPVFFINSPARGIPAVVDIGSSSAEVRVRRTDAGSSGDCVDTDVWPTTGSGGLTVSWRANGTARLLIPGLDGPSSGRCAGPPAGTLGAALSGQTSGTKHRSFTFPATSRFAAGPYSGTLVSTLAFRPAPSNGFSSGSETGTSYPGKPKTAPFEQVTLRVRLAIPAANLGVTFHGVADPTCAILDSCGVQGNVTVGLPARQMTVTLIAQRRVTRRVTRARALADFRTGRLRLDLPLGGSTAVVSTMESLQRAGATPCSDANHIRTPLQIWLSSPFRPPTGSRVPVLLTPEQDWSGLFRTACPGPLGTDVFGGFTASGAQPSLVSGATTLAALLSRHSSVHVRAGGTFSGPGYVGTRSGAFTLALTLLKVSAGTIREPVG